MIDHEHRDGSPRAGTMRQPGMAADEHERTPADAPHYLVPGDALAYGASLGNGIVG